MKTKILVIALVALAVATPAAGASGRHLTKSAIDNWSSRARGISSDTSPMPQDRRVHTPIKIVRPSRK
jgi:hypothetical protein